MPMLLYWPLIVWMGMFEAAQADLVPAEVKARK
jgi:hypothetical protein